MDDNKILDGRRISATVLIKCKRFISIFIQIILSQKKLLQLRIFFLSSLSSSSVSKIVAIDP